MDNATEWEMENTQNPVCVHESCSLTSEGSQRNNELLTSSVSSYHQGIQTILTKKSASKSVLPSDSYHLPRKCISSYAKNTIQEKQTCQCSHRSVKIYKILFLKTPGSPEEISSVQSY
ncbi:hypothetical protein Y1Q_0000607 [Alligator mississippiensis]|uniref:Uncharacterized protein n=1 Tax=Alligator mississippiensis TaxID=8496 RepID=A0A151MBR4_ALLMI|nr:hypothetical protein Y1Q_0000607 [Alligator mississippiensis]